MCGVQIYNTPATINQETEATHDICLVLCPTSLVMSAERIYCFRCNAMLSQQLSYELVFLLEQCQLIQNLLLALCVVPHCTLEAWCATQSCLSLPASTVRDPVLNAVPLQVGEASSQCQ